MPNTNTISKTKRDAYFRQLIFQELLCGNNYLLYTHSLSVCLLECESRSQITSQHCGNKQLHIHGSPWLSLRGGNPDILYAKPHHVHTSQFLREELENKRKQIKKGKKKKSKRTSFLCSFLETPMMLLKFMRISGPLI